MSKNKAQLPKLNYIKMSGRHTQPVQANSNEGDVNVPKNEKLDKEQIDQNLDQNQSEKGKKSIKQLAAQQESDFKFKKFATTERQEEQKPKLSLPKFLEKLSTSNNSTKVSESRMLTVVGDAQTDKSTKGQNFNPNSFSSIFTRDHEEISGIQRVFKKSITLMLLNLLVFGGVVLSGVSLFNLPILLTLVVCLFFVAICNIFFIIVADRSYVWLSIAGQLILLLLVQSFLGQGFDPITLIMAGLIILLIYQAYAELEKIQLGSRLFSITHVTSEATRILSSVVVLVLCLGVFNSIISQGPENFFNRVFLENQFVFNNVIMVEGRPDLSLNRVFVKGYSLYGDNNQTYTLRDFLTSNYRSGSPVISETDEDNIIINCENTRGVNQCANVIAQERDRRLEDWRQTAYPRITYSLDEVINAQEFRELSRQHYLYLIRSFSEGNVGGSNLIIIPRSYILPALFTLALYILLIIVKPVFNWVVFILTWIMWSILKALGFVKIEVETVEAEIVSI